MENNALITFTMILPIIELCMGIANAVSVKDKIQYPINNPANIHSCDFVPFHAVLNTSDIINLGSIMYNICLLCVDTNVKYIVEKNNFIFVLWGIERSVFFNGREKWAKGFENQRV